MNQTAISPTHRPNLCACGHDIRVHNLAASPNTCLLCVQGSAGQVNVHNFTPEGSLTVDPPFGARNLPDTLAPGSFIPLAIFTANAFTAVSSSGNAAGSLTISFTALSLLIGPGFIMTTFPNNPQNQATYRIVSKTGNVLTLDRGLVVATNSVTCKFFHPLGNTPGAGRPANGQRAG